MLLRIICNNSGRYDNLLLMREEELYTFEVRQFRFNHSSYGDCIDEVWICKETGKQFRSFDLPSRGFYHPETFEPFAQFWTLKNGEWGREGGKPDHIVYHDKRPHMMWHAKRPYAEKPQHIFSAYPKRSEPDPVSGRLRHVYEGTVDIAYEQGTEGAEFPEPTYDRPLTIATPKLVSPV